jgi:hypothetical protein
MYSNFFAARSRTHGDDDGDDYYDDGDVGDYSTGVYVDVLDNVADKADTDCYNKTVADDLLVRPIHRSYKCSST